MPRGVPSRVAITKAVINDRVARRINPDSPQWCLRRAGMSKAKKPEKPMALNIRIAMTVMTPIPYP
jgi:hypothetical protein